ncbi:MAG: hypothetical protein V7761_02315 [Amylibacter sp.]
MKKILIHLGPHKTGSTAIQKLLNQNSTILRSHGINFVHTKHVHEAAMAMAGAEYEKSEKILSMLANDMESSSSEQFILSQEDFAGHLIGRDKGRKVYPRLTKHLRILNRAFNSFDVSFLFFTRNEDDWLRSCYVQNLKYRTAFSSFNGFERNFREGFNWDIVLEKPKVTFKKALQIREYKTAPTDGLSAILEHFELGEKIENFDISSAQVNVSPASDVVEGLEHINQFSDSKPTAWFAKRKLMAKTQYEHPLNESHNSWPPNVSFNNDCGLPALSRRASSRVPTQDLPDILPDINVDLKKLAQQSIPDNKTLPNASRADIEIQSRILEYHFRGKSRLAHLNALSISYLRRDTRHTQKASDLFHRIWDECGLILVNELATRWLISVLQTFADHGRNEQQRIIGTTGYFYGNVIKIYEGERAIEGHPQDATYENSTPQTKNEFRGMDRFDLGGTDLMLNTNALALEISSKDPVAGLVLEEFLVRVKTSKNVFSRLDQSRAKMNIDKVNFSDTWCFFEKPT